MKLKIPVSTYLCHRETPGSWKIERYQPMYLVGETKKKYVTDVEFIWSKILDYCIGDCKINISINEQLLTNIKITQDNDVIYNITGKDFNDAILLLGKELFEEYYE